MDVFLGYSYYAPHGEINGIPFHDVNLGAIGSFAYYFNRYFGGEFTLASHPDGPGDGFTTLSLGPILRYPSGNLTMFAHASAGAARFAGPNYDGFYANGDPGHFVNPYRWGPALTVGGGMDYRLARHLSWRVFQADFQYLHASFGPLAVSATPPTVPPPPVGGDVRPAPADATILPVSSNIIGGRANIRAAQLSTGLVFNMGSIVPPPPVTYSCSASPAEVFPGEPITVTGNALNLNPKKTPTYTWTSTTAKVSGTSSTGNVDTADLAPGTYTVHGHVTEGTKAGQSADCSTTFTVKAYEPPTVSCSANPTSVNPGESSTITAQGVSPQNRPLTYSYSASAGQISGSTSTATLDTTGAAPGPITVTCNVADDKGQTASSTTTVTVNAPPPPPAPKTETLCSISFTRDHRRPTRVDNEAKACLDEVALNLQQNADATAVLVGNAPSNERHATSAAAQRAVNTKAYLVNEKGIDASRIEVRTGNAGTESVQDYLVPSGANFENDVPGTSPVASTLKPSRNAYPHTRVTRRHRR